MNAKEAREKSQKNINLNSKSQLNSIIKFIEKATKESEFSIWVYEPISADTRATLTNLGYTIGNTIFERNETTTKISW